MILNSDTLPPSPDEQHKRAFQLIANIGTPLSVAVKILQDAAKIGLQEAVGQNEGITPSQAFALTATFVDESLENAHISRERLRKLLAMSAVISHTEAAPPRPLIVPPTPNQQSE